ncbi:MAG TPA: hypothetical protein VJS64_07055 [Pyrinomonadaceae bacterium]|nr:hypothetical protein [Pyrinomonadaceae bacterium]
MKGKIDMVVKAVSLALLLSFAVSPTMAQENSSKGEIKKSGSEAKNAGTNLGTNVKHGRFAKGGKSFGMHMGKAGKHLGRSTRKAFQKVF